MGLISYTNIENDASATANVWNERFGKIYGEFNGNIDAANLKDGAVTIAKLAADVFSRIYPVGSIYYNATDSTNPGTLLGFGTWAAFGQGRVLVGKSDAGTFSSAGTEVGTETETLTIAQIPSHSHGVNDPGHSHLFSGSNTDNVTNQRAIEWSDAVDINAGSTAGSGTGISIQNNGGGGSHNNIQPSVVVYAWKRTG